MTAPAPRIHPRELSARAAKRTALIRQASRLVDHPDDPHVAALLAATLERWNRAQWASLATCAGVRAPSELTASQVIAEFRERAKGTVVSVSIDGPEYETDGGRTASDLYHCTARVTNDGIEWLTIEVQRNEGSVYGDAFPLTLAEAESSRELGVLSGYDHLAVAEYERVTPFEGPKTGAVR